MTSKLIKFSFPVVLHVGLKDKISPQITERLSSSQTSPNSIYLGQMAVAGVEGSLESSLMTIM